MAVEDFTTWTEVDSTSVLTVTSSQVSIDGLTGQALSTGVYVDKGADYWTGNFVTRVGPVNASASSDLGKFVVFSIARGAPYLADIRSGVGIRWDRYGFGTTSRLYLYYNNTTNATLTHDASDFYEGTAVGMNTSYYVELERSGTTVTAKIYSDAYSTLVDTLSISVTADSYSHAYVAGAYNNGSGTTTTATIQNVDLSPGGSIVPQAMATYRMRQA